MRLTVSDAGLEAEFRIEELLPRPEHVSDVGAAAFRSGWSCSR
jgi:hypothetical protein